MGSAAVGDVRKAHGVYMQGKAGAEAIALENADHMKWIEGDDAHSKSPPTHVLHRNGSFI